MRTPRRVDRNQAEIVAALRKAGCSVQSLASIGKGCPDLLVGRAGKNYLLEVKDGTLPPSKRSLTVDEGNWCAAWDGNYCVVVNIEEALWAVGL